jgi:hypothetical protein
VNVRSPGYFIARGTAGCGHCGRATAVTALAVPGGHEVLLSDEDSSSSSGPMGTWERAPHHAFLFHVESLPEAIQHRLGARVGIGAGWSNHCEHCGGRLEDQDLICELGAIFCPENMADAARICLTWVGEPFAALAAGYAPDPQFFDAISRE